MAADQAEKTGPQATYNHACWQHGVQGAPGKLDKALHKQSHAEQQSGAPGLAASPTRSRRPGLQLLVLYKTPQAWGSLGSERRNAELRGRHARRCSSAACTKCSAATC